MGTRYNSAKRRWKNREAQAGFSLVELLISLAVFLVISAMVMSFMINMTMTQGTIANRAEMHSTIRSATEILQQEISQAGRISFPTGNTTLSAAITANATTEQTVTVGNTAGMFGSTTAPKILLVVGSGATEETVAARVVSYGSGGSIAAIFTKNHASGDAVLPAGSFINGILSYTNGNTLMMFGDIHDTGSMVFVRYDCQPNAAGDGKLYRREMPWDASTTNVNTNYPAEILLTNLKTNPVDSTTGTAVPCFTFQTKDISWTALDGVTVKSATAATSNPAVLNVAVTLTGRTEFKDPKTNQYQFQTKALLTVSPRNVFQAWDMATAFTGGQHVQEVPAQITALVGAVVAP